MGRTVRCEGSFARERPARARVRKMPLALVVAIALAAGVGFPRGVAAASAAPSKHPAAEAASPAWDINEEGIGTWSTCDTLSLIHI